MSDYLYIFGNQHHRREMEEYYASEGGVDYIAKAKASLEAKERAAEWERSKAEEQERKREHIKEKLDAYLIEAVEISGGSSIKKANESLDKLIPQSSALLGMQTLLYACHHQDKQDFVDEKAVINQKAEQLTAQEGKYSVNVKAAFEADLGTEKLPTKRKPAHVAEMLVIGAATAVASVAVGIAVGAPMTMAIAAVGLGAAALAVKKAACGQPRVESEVDKKSLAEYADIKHMQMALKKFKKKLDNKSIVNDVSSMRHHHVEALLRKDSGR